MKGPGFRSIEVSCTERYGKADNEREIDWASEE